MFKKNTFLVSLLVATFSFSQTVSTIVDGNFYDSIDQDSQGNIYCSDFFNGTVYKYDTSGNVTTFKTGLINPNGISVNEQDEIFICDAGDNTVFRYDTTGAQLSAFTSNINNPTGIRNIPGTTDMLLVEYNNSTLKRLEINGTVTTLFTGFPLNGPSGIAIVNGETFISNYNDRKIMKFENGSMTLLSQLPASAPNNNALGFITASDSKIYATQIGAHQIYEVDPVSGNALVYAGSTVGNTDGDISVATFNFPNGILADTANDRIYVSDAGTSNLRIINNASLSTAEFVVQSVNLKVVVDRTNDSLNIQANLLSTNKVIIKIFDITGKEVFEKDFTVSDTTFSENIDSSDLSAGTYIVLLTQYGRIIIKKVIL